MILTGWDVPVALMCLAAGGPPVLVWYCGKRYLVTNTMTAHFMFTKLGWNMAEAVVEEVKP